MPKPEETKLFTLDQANAMLPRVKTQLEELRRIKLGIVAGQARVDIEELTAPGGRKPTEKIEPLLKSIESEVHRFHKLMDQLADMGVELKDLEKGLIDFYSMRDNEIIFLCWQEGEASIEWWHPLDTGFQGRQPLESEREERD